MATVREIAELAGVSKSTVSLVLNNKPGVSDEMRRVVLDAKNRLDKHQPHMQDAVALMTKAEDEAAYHRADHTPLSIVVLHPPVISSSYVFSEVLKGIQSAAGTYNVQLRFVANDPNATEQHVSYLYFSDPNLRPDGVLAFGAQQHEPLLEEARSLGIPCVALGREANKYDTSGLGRNEARYAYEATCYLMSMGHRAIAFVGGESVYDYMHNRVQGYKRALIKADMQIVPHWIQHGNGKTAMHNLLQLAPEVTAVLFVNDACAAAGLAVIEQAGLVIPHDISVISFDDTDIAREYDPPLTSISYKRFEEGQWAVKMLVDQIRYPYVERVQVTFNADFIERESCAPPREG